MKTLRVLGIMSGTSLGSVDYALCTIGVRHVRLEDHWQARYPARLQKRLDLAAQGKANCHELAQLHHDLGRFYAGHAAKFRREQTPQLVGLHGQTLFHQPRRPSPATFQAGEPAYLVEKLRIPVVSNFRVADVAAGGQGAPLAALFHQMVFAQRGKHVCVNNLGGISNVTSIDWRTGPKPLIAAFDTGPGNMLIDLAMRLFTGGKLTFDKNGAWAARGRVNDPLLNRWLKLEYFHLPPPKSTGREQFGEHFLDPVWRQSKTTSLSKYDLLATITEFTARSLALSYKLHLPSIPQQVILAGGGAANPVLVGALRKQLQILCPSIALSTADSLGWPLQTIEAAAFALLAWLRVHERPGNLPETTGATRPALLGQISEP